MYVYIESEHENGWEFKPLYTVGFYDPKGEWHPESDHPDKNSAAARVAYLNGRNSSMDEALNSGRGVYKP